MAEKNYLWLRFFARTFDAFLYIFLFLLLSFFLRKINSYIFTPYLFSPYHSFLSLSIIFIILSICEFYIFIFIIDCLFYYFFGNNIGKIILGLKIVNADTGNKLNLTDYSDRTMRQMFSGFGLGIPLVYLITFFIQYNIVFRKNRTSYDAKINVSSDEGNDILYKIVRQPVPTLNIVMFSLLYVLLIIAICVTWHITLNMYY